MSTEIAEDSVQGSSLKKNRLSEWFRLFRDILLIFTLFILSGVFVIQPVTVEGTSMLPNLHEGDRLLVYKLTYYRYPALQRGDIVFFSPAHNPELTYVKRIVGMPGEIVEIRNGVVFINDTELKEPYLAPPQNAALPNEPPVRVDDYHYFVMGDNREYSSDSRYWGAVPEKLIAGKAVFRYWKPGSIGWLSDGNSELQEQSK